MSLTTFLQEDDRPPVQTWTLAYFDNLLRPIGDDLSDSAGLTQQRTQLGLFVDVLRASGPDSALEIQVLELLLQKLQPRALSFEEVVVSARERLADLYESTGQWIPAARALQGIPLDSAHRPNSNTYKLAVYIRQARLFLAAHDPLSAELGLNRAASLIYDCEGPNQLLQFKLAQARVFDSKHKFLEAQTKYYDASLATQLSEDDRMSALSRAMVCAIIASTGPQRTRALAQLFKDDRTRTSPLFPMLEKMYHGGLIQNTEIVAFRHALAELGEVDPAVLNQAIWEHNLIAASQIYTDMTLDHLARLLGDIPVEQAEHMVSRMITQDRLPAVINRTDRLVLFHQQTNIDDIADVSLRRYDDQIRNCCLLVDKIAETIQTKYPECDPKSSTPKPCSL
ncbi:hypothetical protein BJ085DRAFT_23575 [Dimargaris cristalligena]|uniref:COP9 signalosome complex subunit 4 n=1 Tax=Dimargaris cristalligena TaxID=215637 RepID=A0A4V1J448_9FUNG|nr:hypothetical protein BJ085DRAFT_23575 [Dimargaris cristalligena]|eukprot:RKP34309.1 hypothetical protein BJ085DRAFT_23575 [Dimargaris cristalligena]